MRRMHQHTHLHNNAFSAMAPARPLSDAGSLITGIGVAGAAVSLGMAGLLGYSLYRVWKSGPRDKTWPWYVLGIATGLRVVGGVIGAGMIAAGSAVAGQAASGNTGAMTQSQIDALNAAQQTIEGY